MATTTADKLLKLEDVMEILGVSRATLYDYIGRRGFPLPVQLTSASNRWRQSEVAAWIDARERARIRIK